MPESRSQPGSLEIAPIDLAAVPGKLMLAGEYAVLRPGGLCLAVAATELVRGRLGARTDRPRFALHAFGADVPVPAPAEHALSIPGLAGFAARARSWLERHQAMALAHELRLEVGGAVGNAKVGLGTSAAVTIATLRAVLRSHALATGALPHLEADDLTRWARAIHAEEQGNTGSGYDVATIAHGGVIAWHRSPDRAQPLDWPAPLHAAALFSGVPAPTRAALDRGPLPDAILDGIAAAAATLLGAWGSGVATDVLAALRSCERAFDQAVEVRPALRPRALDDLRICIESAGCVARTSGAGGGDCVLALAATPEAVARAMAAWTAEGGNTVAVLPRDLAPALLGGPC